MSALPKSDTTDLLIGMIRDPLLWVRWPEARELLNPALLQSDDDWPAVEASLASNDKQLWAVLKGGDLLAVAVTRIALSRTGEVAEIYLLGGHDLMEWMADLDAVIEQSAREIGCVAMRAYGRAGWKKPLATLGWEARAIAYEKPL